MASKNGVKESDKQNEDRRAVMTNLEDVEALIKNYRDELRSLEARANVINGSLLVLDALRADLLKSEV